VARALGDLFDELLNYAAVTVSRLAGELVRDLEHAMLSRGPFERAAYEAAQAHLLGKNPLWAGAKGAWAGASVPQRLVAVLILILLLVLAPVPVLLLRRMASDGGALCSVHPRHGGAPHLAGHGAAEDLGWHL
jgi:cytochrome c-type biogenesis protein CcmH/NrfG